MRQRVIVLTLCVSRGTFFSTRGEKGGKRGEKKRKGEGKEKRRRKRKRGRRKRKKGGESEGNSKPDLEQASVLSCFHVNVTADSLVLGCFSLLDRASSVQARKLLSAKAGGKNSSLINDSTTADSNVAVSAFVGPHQCSAVDTDTVPGYV